MEEPTQSVRVDERLSRGPENRSVACFKGDDAMRRSSCISTFDNTLLSNFDKCDRNLYWFHRGLRPINKPAYFTWGSAFQEGMEGWYLTDGDTATRLKEAQRRALAYWDDDAPVEYGYNKRYTLEWSLFFYAIEYSHEPWTLNALPTANGPRMELGFEYPCKDFYLSGALDGYIDWPPFGPLALECKTSGIEPNEKYHRQWKFSGQVSQYYWGLWKILGELPFGVLMNVAGKEITLKALDQFKADGTIPEGIFSRNLEKRSKYKCLEFEEETAEKVDQIRRQWKTWVWPKTRDVINCVGGMGRSACDYQHLCKQELHFADIEDPTAGTLLKWQDKPWEPWKRGE